MGSVTLGPSSNLRQLLWSRKKSMCSPRDPLLHTTGARAACNHKANRETRKIEMLFPPRARHFLGYRQH